MRERTAFNRKTCADIQPCWKVGKQRAPFFQSNECSATQKTGTAVDADVCRPMYADACGSVALNSYHHEAA
jgi:hypothetical protein